MTILCSRFHRQFLGAVGNRTFPWSPQFDSNEDIEDGNNGHGNGEEDADGDLESIWKDLFPRQSAVGSFEKDNFGIVFTHL